LLSEIKVLVVGGPSVGKSGQTHFISNCSFDECQVSHHTLGGGVDKTQTRVITFFFSSEKVWSD
jgi:adenylate kinase family enzyme